MCPSSDMLLTQQNEQIQIQKSATRNVYVGMYLSPTIWYLVLSLHRVTMYANIELLTLFMFFFLFSSQGQVKVFRAKYPYTAQQVSISPTLSVIRNKNKCLDTYNLF